ncbi:hypothetical protein [Streptomyces melanogenes]|uniref:hypothetical protein n=1 Tax=Streptomyces melanogenes TaxID=67326 RepID=UPI0037A57343
MNIVSFSASADLIGRRVLLRWVFLPFPGESAPDTPAVTVRRKQRDFAFAPPAPDDAQLVYDSARFPPSPVPGALTVVDLPDRDRTEGSTRVREQTVTVAEFVSGQAREVLRRTVRTVFGADRRVLRREVELLDVGGPGATLRPGETYYYQLDSPSLPGGPDRDRFRATATPGEVHGNHRTLYELIPQIYRRHDTVPRAADAGTGLLPEASTTGGQLRRFVDPLGAALDAVLSSADGLRGLRDTARVDHRFLPLLAQWIGWDLTVEDDIARQRHEIAAAPRLYGSVGSVPGLRGIVDHYTGWSTRVAEYAQHIARANVPPQRNLFASVRRDGVWWGADEAAPVLGFAAPNGSATGADGTPARLVGAVAEPFALRPGMSLTVAVDGGLPSTVTFGAADFTDLGHATAAEVADVVNRVVGQPRADVVAGAVRFTSPLLGRDSRIEVSTAQASLVSLDGAPGGRLATVVDAAERLWVAHATTVGPGDVLPRLSVKPYLRGSWRDGMPVEARPTAPQADPALVELPGGRLWLAWVEHPGTPEATLRWRTGAARPMEPARIRGEFSGPFRLADGTRMTLTGYSGGATFTQAFLVRAADYADVGAATATEVAQAFNAQLTAVAASAAADGSLALRTTAAGPEVTLRVRLSDSTAARVLGFGDRRLSGRGTWEAGVDWAEAAPVTPVAAGRHAECTAAVDPEGAVRLAWSTHVDGAWRTARARWDGRLLVGSPSGLSVRAADGSWSTLTAGLPHRDVRDVEVDADGAIWFATAGGAAVRRPDGSLTAMTKATTGGGLAGDDVRAVAVAPDGTVWFAHPAGASARLPDGTWRTETAQSDPALAGRLASNDVRHVLVDATGAVWFATSAGVSRLAGGVWTTFDGVPGAVRQLAVANDRAVWAATDSGVVRIGEDGAVTRVDLSALVKEAADAKAIAVETSPADPARGAVWVATEAGLLEVRSALEVRLHSAVTGLPVAGCRAVLVTPDRAVWVGGTNGLARRGPGGDWQMFTTANGPADNQVRGLYGPWSAPQWFDSTGGGERDPHLVRDGNRLWLAWSQIQTAGDEADRRLIRLRRFDWPGPAWSPPLDVTALPPGGSCTDAEPTVAPAGAGAARVYFRSNRGGGPGVFTVDVSAANVVGPPVAVITGPSAEADPAPVTLPGGVQWLLIRSDRNVPLGRLGGGIPGGADTDASRRAPEEAATRRFAGLVTATPAHLDRNRLRHRFGDLLTYTPQRPDGGPYAEDDLYTPGTIGLYVERSPAGRPLVRRDADRLRQLLRRFLPLNMRAVVVIQPGDVDETVFPPGHPLLDAYRDKYPLAEVYRGPMDTTAVSLPGWQVFLSTDPQSLTANKDSPTTLRRRTWWPPFQ